MKKKLYDLFLNTPHGATITILMGGGLLIGLMLGAMSHKHETCQYNSIFSRVNVGYILGCELTRPRFEPVCYPLVSGSCEK